MELTAGGLPGTKTASELGGFFTSAGIMRDAGKRAQWAEWRMSRAS
jgi:hypothetical protein